MTTSESPSRPRAARRRAAVPAMIRQQPGEPSTAPPPQLHRLHGPWTLAVVDAGPGAPPLSAAVW